MTTPADLAALRLELSPGELVCPKKGQMARGRCTQLQEEMACTCAVAAAAGCAIGEGWTPPAPPPPPTESELARREAIRAGLLRRRIAAPATSTAKTAATKPHPVAATTTAKTTTAAPAAAKETEMPDTEKILAAMRAEPKRDWTRAELAELRGTAVETTGVALARLSKEGTIENVGRGLYRWAGSEEEAPAPKPAKKAKPAKKSPPKPARPEPEEVVAEEAAAEHDPIDDRLRWLIDGVVRGFISRGDCVAQIKALVQ